MHRILLVVLVLAAAVSPCGAAEPGQVLETWLEQARAHVPQVDTQTLRKLVDGDRDFVLLDVRLPGERQEAGAIDPFREVAIPRGYLEFKVPGKIPDTATPIIVYCGTGKRSLLAARTLQRMGYTRVRNYRGGFQAWKAAGLPVAPPMTP
ncbi:MAG TPA: rhodanese-like domain-containing protein [Gammaproteobacteria bacterium]|nr:rhodanese-like domain-containing protein [Gammaproteobacteria bacterium]